ncbi:MAG: metallophosphoesterase family protein [Deltaproteobacteria bacterium]|nr:metallophosphoesterase family protein [Deltaproteobacteria bacterium]
MQIFVADIHIRPGNDRDKDRFLCWLKRIRPQAEHIYILGDLFDFWYSGLEDALADVLDALRHPNIHIMPGNRDFLLHNLKNDAIDIIASEEIVVNLYGRDVLLAHGHTLTMNDYGFKCLHLTLWPLLRFLDSQLPLSLKEKCARSLVNTSARIRPPQVTIPVDAARKHGVNTLVCGHLHTPRLRQEMIVLPAFVDNGSFLIWDQDGPRFTGG